MQLAYGIVLGHRGHFWCARVISRQGYSDAIRRVFRGYSDEILGIQIKSSQKTSRFCGSRAQETSPSSPFIKLNWKEHIDTSIFQAAVVEADVGSRALPMASLTQLPMASLTEGFWFNTLLVMFLFKNFTDAWFCVTSVLTGSTNLRRNPCQSDSDCQVS